MSLDSSRGSGPQNKKPGWLIQLISSHINGIYTYKTCWADFLWCKNLPWLQHYVCFDRVVFWFVFFYQSEPHKFFSVIFSVGTDSILLRSNFSQTLQKGFWVSDWGWHAWRGSWVQLLGVCPCLCVMFYVVNLIACLVICMMVFPFLASVSVCMRNIRPYLWTHHIHTSLHPQFTHRLFTLHHKNPIKFQENDENVLAGEEDHQLVEHLLLSHEVEPVNQERTVLEPNSQQQAPHFTGATGGESGRSAWTESTQDPLQRLPQWRLSLGQYQRKLHESPGEQGQANDDDCTVGLDFRFLESVKDVQDVSSQSHVYHEELGELVTRHVAFGHQPPAQN